MPRPRVTSQMTTAKVCRELGMKIGQLINWVECGVLPPPSAIDKNSVRYFDQEWLRKARQILRNKQR